MTYLRENLDSSGTLQQAGKEQNASGTVRLGRLVLRVDQFERGLDLDGSPDGARDRTVIRVNAVDSLDRFVGFLGSAEPVVDGNVADDENISIEIDFSQCFGGEFTV